MRSTERVKVACAAAGLDVEIRTMPQSTRTAEEAAAACGVGVGQIVKSLVFRKAASRQPVLVLVSGVNRVDQQAAQAEIGEPLDRIDAATVREVTGFAIGGVAPLGSLTPLDAYMDEDLLAFDTIWAAAGAPDTVFGTSPQALAKATGARLIKVRA